MNAVIGLICLSLSAIATGRPTEVPWGGRSVDQQYASGWDKCSPLVKLSDVVTCATSDRDKTGTNTVRPETRNPQGIDWQRLTDFRFFQAEDMGFEPGVNRDVSVDDSCDCDFCQGYRAALALHARSVNCRSGSLIDADLQQIMERWSRLPTTIQEAILSLIMP